MSKVHSTFAQFGLYTFSFGLHIFVWLHT